MLPKSDKLSRANKLLEPQRVEVDSYSTEALQDWEETQAVL